MSSAIASVSMNSPLIHQQPQNSITTPMMATNPGALINVKQERHDEAEIRELAEKMKEAHKAATAKTNLQQQQQQQQHQPGGALGQNAVQRNMVGALGQTNILNYLTRKNNTTSVTDANKLATGTNAAGQQTATKSNGEITENGSSEKKPCDEESLKGHFGWATFGRIHIPYILRQAEKYCAVRMVEMKLLNKYLNYLHQDIYSCTCVRSYYITEAESRLLNEINHKHCDSQFGREQFSSSKDLVVRLSDANKFYQFLDICYKKLLMGSSGPSDKCGFIRINKESVVPYTVRDTQKFVPLFYFEGETDNLKLKADYLSGWDLSYLKFCCKVQGIRNELFASDQVAVISLTDIKSYFPTGTEFEDYWPSKVVDSQLLVCSTKPNSSVHWTRQPAQPPQKVLNIAPKNPAGVRKPPTNASYPSLPNPAQRIQQGGNMNSVQNSLAATQAIQNGWTTNFPGAPNTFLNGLLTDAQASQVLRMAHAQNQAHQQQQQHAAQRTYSAQVAARSQQMQSALNRQAQGYQYPTGVLPMSSQSQGQAPPPLVRSQQNAAATVAQQMSSVTGPQTTLRSNSQPMIMNSSLPSSTTITSYQTNFEFNKPNNNINNNNMNFMNKNRPNIELTPSFPTTLLSYPKTGNSANSPIPIGSPARASPQSASVKHPPPPLIPMFNGPNGLQITKHVIETGSKSPYTNTNIHLSPRQLSPMTPQTYLNYYSTPKTNNIFSNNNNININNNMRLTSVITSTPTDVIDLSSPPRSALAAASLQQQVQQQQRSAASITNGRSANGVSSGGHNVSSAAAALHHQRQQQLQQQQQHQQHQQQQQQQQAQQRQHQDSALRLHVIPDVAGSLHTPYKVQRVLVENAMVPCINMKPYIYTELLMSLSDLKEYFFQNVSLEHCRKVLEVLDIEMYKGNRRQIQTIELTGKQHPETMPLIQVRDIVQYMPQMKYIIKGQNSEAPANKRARIS